MRRLRKAALLVSQRQDLMVVLLLVLSIVLMILPLPTLLVDVGLASNMALTILLLMVAVYVRNPLDFFMLPSIILLATVFRLALSIATTRLILMQADAGEIVRTFGEFVVAGNLIVGLVIFLIITIVQFVVITKGSERVAEVSARFTLDALPGKQMSIDAELRSGEIDQAEARGRRSHLEKESQLYGSMDGAMKFVKGDAIAGLIIIAVNLLGGLAVGTLQHGLSLGEALATYSVLTVGDGLVAQIPALFVALTAGTVVTRVTSDDNRDLGADVVRQLVSEPRALTGAALCLFGIGFVPGFPTPVFLALAAALGGLALVIERRARKAAEGQEADDPAILLEEDRRTSAGERITVGFSPAVEEHYDWDSLVEELSRLPDRLRILTGVPLPRITLRTVEGLEPQQLRLDLDGVPVTVVDTPPDRVCLREHPDDIELMNLDAEPVEGLTGERPAFWVAAGVAEDLSAGGFAWMSAEEVVAEKLQQVLGRHLGRLVGLRETQQVLKAAEQAEPALAHEVVKLLSPQKLRDVYRRLADEGVPLHHHRLLLEGLLDLAAQEQDPSALAEYLRGHVARQLCHSYADGQKCIPVFLLERSLEEMLRGSVKHNATGGYLAIPDRTRRRLLEHVRTHLRRAEEHGIRPVVLTSLDLRRYVRQFLANNDIHMPVLGHSELARDFKAQPMVTLRLSTGVPGEPPAGKVGWSLAEQPSLAG